MTAITLHHLCTLFPRISGQEFASLVADIKAYGQREPIIMHEGMILDGGNRYRACIEAGVEPQTMRFGGGDIVAYVLSANLHRRHLSSGQNAAIVASCQDWAAAHFHGGDRKSDQAVTLPLDTVAARQAQSGASDKTQRDADRVAKADPDLAKAVCRGETTLSKATAQITGKERTYKSPEAAPAEEESEVDRLTAWGESNAILAKELLAENEAMSAVIDSDEKLAALSAENKKLREMNRILEDRNRGITEEKNAAIRAAKDWKRKFEKATNHAA